MDNIKAINLKVANIIIYAQKGFERCILRKAGTELNDIKQVFFIITNTI